jgi:putative hemolysin
VGEGAFIDHDFNCTDVCMVMDTTALNRSVARHYDSAGAQ